MKKLVCKFTVTFFLAVIFIDQAKCATTQELQYIKKDKVRTPLFLDTCDNIDKKVAVGLDISQDEIVEITDIKLVDIRGLPKYVDYEDFQKMPEAEKFKPYYQIDVAVKGMPEWKIFLDG
ncbi:MAG: hypothetical protein JXA66_07650, partial [Oligoflexia bacterium]|nr:hypothetical protein [Oligoflexia bacterium]